MTNETIPYGYCQCGCGELTTIAPKHNRRYGWVKGEPKRFRKGHSGRRSNESLWSSALYEVRDCGYETPCWVWLGTQQNGYGRWRSKILAYRYSWERINGQVPEGLELDHLCRHPFCVNPDHLEAVTPQENKRRGANTKLTFAKAQEIRALRTQGVSVNDLAVMYGVERRTIGDVLHGRRWLY